MIVQGAESNHSGVFLEQAIENEFKRRKIQIFDWSQKGDNIDMFVPNFLLRNVPYTSLYGCKSRSEFVYRDFRFGMEIRIECRWQQAQGSVDEKLPYLYLNAVEHMPEREIWLICEGNGARPEAINWLKRRCAQEAAKDIRVLSLVEARRHIQRVTS